MPKTMKLLGSTKSKTTKDENGENVPRLEITEVVLVHCYIVNSDYQQDLRISHTSVLNISFGQLLVTLPKNFIFLKSFNSESLYTEVWFSDSNSELLEIGDKRSITLVID